MNSAFYRSTDYLFARPSSDDGKRVATTITLITVATCMVLAKSFAAPHPPGVQSGEVQTVRIVDPDFCKNQTWPYIDARCLKRIAPDQPVAENHAGIVSANPQVTPTPAAPLASAAANGAPASGNFAVSDTSDAAGSAMHGTPLTAVDETAPDRTIFNKPSLRILRPPRPIIPLMHALRIYTVTVAPGIGSTAPFSVFASDPFRGPNRRWLPDSRSFQ